MVRTGLLAALLAFCLAGCAPVSTISAERRQTAERTDSPTPAHGRRMAGWLLDVLVRAETERAMLAVDNRQVALVELAHLRAAWTAAQRLLRELPEQEHPVLLIAEGSTPNAFVFFRGNRAHVAANIGMLRLLTDDEAAWAALYGHEFAHLQRRHRETRAERKATAQTTSDLLGLALSVAGIPLGDLIADSATTLVERGYSRDEEREADRLGLLAMQRAGYDPAGAIRLQERLATAGGGARLPFLSTHPGSAERLEAMRALVRELAETPVTHGN